ncbi:junctophilin-2-like [Meleagris gallopavo]|uniref:junctophilin-2-like n=1 Tax=Meleagris gallopavo TaxID=9103 RepID=UPI000549B1A1|nr:junctophilin-2-like [Meleagris gallopavo]
MENAEHAVNMEEAMPPQPKGAPPPPTPPESPQLHEQDEAPRRRSPAPSPAATPPEAKRAKAQQDGAPRPGSWAGPGSGGASDGEGRPASRGAAARPAEQMEIRPLQRMAREPDVEHYKGYHSYPVRTSPVSPAADYEEEPLSERGLPSPEPQGEPRRRGGTPVQTQEPAERHAPQAEAKAEAKAEQPQPKELKQPRRRPSPERKAVSRSEPADDRKTEGRAPGRTEQKAGAKRSPAPVVAVAAVQDAEEGDEGPNTIVICMVILLNIGLAILFVHFLT